MAGRVNVADLLVAVSSMEMLEKCIELSEEKLVIADIHEEWCGPCMAVMPFYNALWLELDDPEKRLSPVTLSKSVSPDIMKKIKGMIPSADQKLLEGGCRPVFMLL